MSKNNPRDLMPIKAGIQPKEPPTGTPVELFSDGACDTTAGHGGWACVMRFGEKELVLSGNETNTTNNRMELYGLLAGLKSLKKPCLVNVVTDSQYLRKAFTDGWILNWQRNGWQTSKKEPVKNKDIWEALIAEAKIHSLTFIWVRGHMGHDENERVDRLAVQERLKLRK